MKVPVFCSLIPAELILAAGYEPHYVDADELSDCLSQGYHCAFHENLCSYSKSLYEYFLKRHGEFELIVIPTACDALKKLYNALKVVVPSDKLYLLDVPQAKGDAAAEFLAGEFEKLKERMNTPPHLASPQRGEGALSSTTFSQRGEGALSSTTFSQRGEGSLSPLPFGERVGAHPGQSRGVRGIPPSLPPGERVGVRGSINKIGIVGSNVPLAALKQSLEKFGLEPIYLNHCIYKSYLDDELVCALRKGIKEYAGLFLKKNSCPRTDDYGYKKQLVDQIRAEGIVAVVANTLKFCDFQPFDVTYLRQGLGNNFPILQIEYDFTAGGEGQVKTRIEAFFENICGKERGSMKRGNGGYYVGIDSGSHATKLVCINRDNEVVCRDVVSTGTSVKESSEMLLGKLAEHHRISRKDIGRVVATGYGRNKIKIADDVITEITCHALGAHYLLGKAATIIDIGGQDSKAIKIDGNGAVLRFAMNDKCAAGTGRFLEVMAAKLEMSLEEFAELALKTKRTVPISSMCSVFAESEVISLIASGKSKEEIVKGIHRAIAERTVALAKRVEGEPPYYMAGGVAKNHGLVSELSDCLGDSLTVLDNPQFSGALGAAIIASRS